jgi:hypothetical protein
MTETAVGLFAHAGAADAVVEALNGIGIPSGNIRVVSAPKDGSGNSEFPTSFSSEFRGMGASEDASGAYLAGLHRGNVLVYATGTKQEADKAADVMNQYSAIEVEEFAGAGVGASRSTGAVHTTDMGTINPEPRLPESNVTIGAHEKSYTSHASRTKTEGAKVFSW